ncbi:peroxiredoxin family protein [Gramella lutea]|uniref:Peroxiredoxin family protein n=1 Tax=Christiangramia lutea TaxID=1607951 RepID=A0A9X1V215_9FLAO|nr:peroxiredoxin family protein [Christiangramia lutea]MCH4822586.1 peroxiredoxin family protein [Christiangramia lutea]
MKTNNSLRSSVFLVSFFLLTIFSFSQDLLAQKSLSGNKTSEIDYKKEAPDFSLLSLDGKTVNLTDYNDKILVIHIATTWCPFCNAEAPYLEKLYQNYKAKGVEVIIIDVKEPKELVEEKLKDRHGLSFPILLDPDGEVAGSFAPKNILPDLSRDEVMLASNIIIDKEGKIQFMSLLDSKNFDAELIAVKKKLDELL